MSVINVSELMTDPDFVETIILRRPAPARLANEGEDIASYEPDVEVVAVVQPATAEQGASLPEGSRGAGPIMRVWSATQLQMAPGVGREADILVIRGLEYKVVGESDWDTNGYRFVLATQLVP